MKSWSERPSNEEVLAHTRAFFSTLVSGELEEAETMVAHAYDDWSENLFNLFQDHVLVHQTPPDSTF